MLKYLARYTHRAAISNRRLVDLADGRGLHHEVRMAMGDPRRGPVESELMAKFLDSAGAVLAAGPARRLADALLHLEKAENVADLFARG